MAPMHGSAGLSSRGRLHQFRFFNGDRVNSSIMSDFGR
jgi:hypothetical protein